MSNSGDDFDLIGFFFAGFVIDIKESNRENFRKLHENEFEPSHIVDLQIDKVEFDNECQMWYINNRYVVLYGEVISPEEKLEETLRKVLG